MQIGRAEKLETGSSAFDILLGGGLARGSVTDVYGAAATGKTQFAFQSALVASIVDGPALKIPAVVFVDCAGSFRPERIAEMADARGYSASKSLDRIFSISVRSVAEQREASERILASDVFEECRLLIVDDATTNFVAEFSAERKDSEVDEDVYIYRHYVLATYARKLALIARSKNIAVLLTNSVRSRIPERNVPLGPTERETMGDIISQYTLFRLHFMKLGNRREARIVEPWLEVDRTSFEIESRGVVP